MWWLVAGAANGRCCLQTVRPEGFAIVRCKDLPKERGTEKVLHKALPPEKSTFAKLNLGNSVF